MLDSLEVGLVPLWALACLRWRRVCTKDASWPTYRRQASSDIGSPHV